MTLLFDSDKSGEWVSQIWFFFPFCHYHSSSIIWIHQNCVFNFHHPNSKFWVFEWWKQTFKTKTNTTSFVRPTSFGWWIIKTKWYYSVFGLSKQETTHKLEIKKSTDPFRLSRTASKSNLVFINMSYSLWRLVSAR